MDYKEAIELLHPETSRNAIWKIADEENAIKKIEEALVMACEAMQELQEYKQLGTLEEVQELVELRKEKRPQKVLGVSGVTEYECQNCGNTIPYLEDYCEWCGQKQDWSV